MEGSASCASTSSVACAADPFPSRWTFSAASSSLSSLPERRYAPFPSRWAFSAASSSLSSLPELSDTDPLNDAETSYASPSGRERRRHGLSDRRGDASASVESRGRRVGLPREPPPAAPELGRSRAASPMVASSISASVISGDFHKPPRGEAEEAMERRWKKMERRWKDGGKALTRHVSHADKSLNNKKRLLI